MICADGRFRPSRPCSSWNGSAPPSRQASDLPVQDAVPGLSGGRRKHLRELVADVIEVAAVEPDLAAQLVQLGADAVVLVLDPDRCRHPRQRLRLVRDRRREHARERVEQGQRRGAQLVVAGQDRGPADVAGEHAGPLDGREVALECLGDARLQVALAEADAQLAAEHLDHGPRGLRVATLQQRPRRCRLGRRATRRRDGRERVRDLPQRGRRAAGPIPGRLEDVADGLAQVRRAVVRGAQVEGRGAASPPRPPRRAPAPRPRWPASRGPSCARPPPGTPGRTGTPWRRAARPWTASGDTGRRWRPWRSCSGSPRSACATSLHSCIGRWYRASATRIVRNSCDALG